MCPISSNLMNEGIVGEGAKHVYAHELGIREEGKTRLRKLDLKTPMFWITVPAAKRSKY